MLKIKEIRERLTKQPHEYSELRFAVAQKVFACMTALYFTTYLFTVGGFYFGPFTLPVLSSIRYHLYSLYIITTIGFLYTICEYWITRHTGGNRWLYIASALIAIVLGIIPLGVHLGKITF